MLSCTATQLALHQSQRRRKTPARARGSQAPLQPLQDNLESQTYETFEKDGTKYAQYQAAVHAALLDRPAPANGAPTSAHVALCCNCRGSIAWRQLAARIAL